MIPKFFCIACQYEGKFFHKMNSKVCKRIRIKRLEKVFCFRKPLEGKRDGKN